MSDKVYRIAVIALLSLILVVMGINTYSQIRGQRRNADFLRERIGEVQEGREGRFPPNQHRQGQSPFQPQFQQQIQPQQISPFEQPQAANPELLENLHRLTAQNEEQARMIRELFGQIEELKHQVDELDEQVESLTVVDEEG